MLNGTSVPFKYLFNKVKADVFRVLLGSATIHVLKHYFREELPTIPISLPTLMGTSISLLLAFNINQSYDRWWEARKIWGAIVNDSRSLIMQVACFVRDQDERPASGVIKQMALRQIAWCYALGQTLRGRTPLTKEQHSLLTEDDLRFVLTQKNQPLGLLMRHQLDVGAFHEHGQINDFQQVQLDTTLVRLCDAMGRAERIKSTVFPVTYRLYVHYSLYLFLVTLSIALVDTVGVLEIPILALFASSFFLIEKTALHMQDPFNDLPTDTAMTAIARTIEVNLRQLIDDNDVPPPLAPEEFYLM